MSIAIELRLVEDDKRVMDHLRKSFEVRLLKTLGYGISDNETTKIGKQYHAQLVLVRKRMRIDSKARRKS